MVLIQWSAWIFSEQFCLWVWRSFFFLLFLIISFFRRLLLKGDSSHLLEALQINWLLCPFPHYNGVVFLSTSVACCGVYLKTHGPCVTAVGIRISQLQSLGLSKIAPGSAAKSAWKVWQPWLQVGAGGSGLHSANAPSLRGWCPKWNSWELRDVLLPYSHGFWNLWIFLHNR